MTLPITSRVNYPGAGSAGPFAIPFRFTSNTDLVVTRRSAAGVETTVAAGSGYTTTGAKNATGALTLAAVLAVGETLSIRRAPELTQATSIRNQGSYFPATHEDVFDRLVMLAQSLQDKIDRSFGLSESYDPAAMTTRLKPETGKALVWQSSTALGNSPLDASATALPGEGRTVTTLSAYLLNNAVYNVHDYGALGDGIADDSAAIQTVLDKIRDNGGTAEFRARTYKCQTALTMLVDSAAKARLARHLKFNGCVLDFSASGITGATPLVKLGATALANVSEIGYGMVGPCTVIGTADQALYQTVPGTLAVGLQLEFAARWTFESFVARYCYIGMEKKQYVWDDVWINCQFRACYIGWVLREYATDSLHLKMLSNGCAHAGAIIVPGLNNVSNQVFIGARAETCLAGFTVDPGTTLEVMVYGLTFKDTYFEAITYDLYRLGIAWDSDPSVRGPNRAGVVIGTSIDDGKWQIEYTATKKPIVFGTNKNVIGIRMSIPARFADLVNRPLHYVWHPQQYKYDITLGVMSSEGFYEGSSNRGSATFHWDGAAIVVDASIGNIGAITRLGIGLYKVAFREFYYSNKNNWQAVASCNGGFVEEDYANGNAGRDAAVFQCRQHDNTAFDPTIVRVLVDGMVSQ